MDQGCFFSLILPALDKDKQGSNWGYVVTGAWALKQLALFQNVKNLITE